MQFSPSAHCKPDEHVLHRRLFLKGLAASGATAVGSFGGLFTNPVMAEAAKKSQKQCLLLWLCGAPSQFETWDPKPGRPSSGPFGSIRTSIPGVHFSSLMPKCATIAHQMNIVRCMHTKQSEHLQAINLLTRGNPDRAGFTRPTLGAAVSAALGRMDTQIPNFILLDPMELHSEQIALFQNAPQRIGEESAVGPHCNSPARKPAHTNDLLYL